MADKRTVDIHGKSYELVSSRVERFRKDHPDWTIRTKIIEVTENRVIMKATIESPFTGGDHKQVVIATGHAEEIRSANAINKTSALEVAETSAIGRALACLGYIGGEYASADEVANAISNQRHTPQIAASDKQLAYILKLFKELKVDDMKTQISVILGREAAAEDLTSKEASEIISALRDEIKEKAKDHGDDMKLQEG